MRPGVSLHYNPAVSSGVGKCCHITDVDSDGCNPQTVKNMENDAEYKDYTLNLMCSSN